jgi:hypothetical protein
MDNKPNNSCYIASQQLGCKTKKLNHGSSFLFTEKVLGNHGYMHHGKKMILKKKKSLWNGFINRGAS